MMTTIVAVQGSGWAVIGCDSRVTDEGRIYNTGLGWSKVVKNNGWLFGVAGDVRAINLVAHAFRAPRPKPELKGVWLDRFVTAEFIPVLREVFDREGYVSGKRNGAEEHGAEILACVNGCVYEIASDWSWCHDVRGLYAVGTGGEIALGALSVLSWSDVVSAKDAVGRALESASEFDNGTSPPFRLFSQLAVV